MKHQSTSTNPSHDPQHYSKQDKADVIDVALASAHIPFFMNRSPYALCRGTHRCIDGSFLYILLGHTGGLVPPGFKGLTRATAGAVAGAEAEVARTAAANAAAAAGGGAAPPPLALVFDPWQDDSLRSGWSWGACLVSRLL